LAKAAAVDCTCLRRLTRHIERELISNSKGLPSTLIALSCAIVIAGSAGAQKAKPPAAGSARQVSPVRRPPPDSAVLLAVATQPKSRTQADSISLVAAIRAAFKNPDWPVKTAPPLPGSIFPAKRVVAFYGNPIAKKMGILGEIPPEQMLARLDTIVAQWRAADPTTPVVPAIHMIVSVAKPEPGKDGKYRQRSDTGLIERA
jgi:hypothetical protein